ncbi:unnamed protein product [Pocillopora meandrina]|uniref:Uncharacterized protein n=1 Tax=Pocillopora meandrina TaxID=46732 RepID=A0AAU9W5Q8_9CNID|nr:unnamed protein product [Pocillopora meandrina]
MSIGAKEELENCLKRGKTRPFKTRHEVTEWRENWKKWKIFLAKPETNRQKAEKYYDGHKSSVPPSLN